MEEVQMTEEQIINRRLFLAKKRKQERNMKQYEKRLDENVYCETCKCGFDKYHLQKHLQTKKHLEMAKLQKDEKRRLCPCCADYIALTYWNKHIKTQRHIRNEKT